MDSKPFSRAASIVGTVLVLMTYFVWNIGNTWYGAIGLLDLMVKCGLTPSKGEARRLITQGGVLVKGEKVTDPTVRFTAQDFAQEFIIKKGKKVFHLVQMGE